jgi:hypothetical protein
MSNGNHNLNCPRERNSAGVVVLNDVESFDVASDERRIRYSKRMWYGMRIIIKCIRLAPGVKGI